MENKIITKDYEIANIENKPMHVKLNIKINNPLEKNNVKLTNIILEQGNIHISNNIDTGIRSYNLEKTENYGCIAVNFKNEYDTFTFTLKINDVEKGRFKIDLSKSQKNITEI